MITIVLNNQADDQAEEARFEKIKKAYESKRVVREVEVQLDEAFSDWEANQQVEVPETYIEPEPVMEPEPVELMVDVDEIEMPTFDSEIDLVVQDLKIDTRIEVADLEAGAESHEGETPLKVVKCSMCGTENELFEINPFETPNCKKCGMLLLNAND